MLMPTEIRNKILENLFEHGVLTCINDVTPKAIHTSIQVRNLYVIKLMKSFESMGYVRKLYAWKTYYWFLTEKGIDQIRDILHIPPDIVPASFKRNPTLPNLDGASKGPMDKTAFRRGQVSMGPGKDTATDGQVKFSSFGRGKQI